jgi:diguanylate cyclase (GGDEF)-like protein
VNTIFGKLRQKTYLVMLILGIGLLEVLAGFMLVNIAADRMVTSEADHYGTGWAEFLSRNIADLESLLKGETPSVETIIFLEQAKHHDELIEFRLFDNEGRQRLVSSELGEALSYQEKLTDAYPELARLIASGEEFTIFTKHPLLSASLARNVSTTFAPLHAKGRLIGWVEVIVNQDHHRHLIVESLVKIAIAMGLLLGLVPAMGFWYSSLQKKKVEQTLSFLTNHDPLTKLPNRTVFAAQLDEALKQAERRHEHTSILDIEIDRLRDLYEQFDRQSIDAVLIEFSNRLQTLAGPLGISARLSDSEFAVLKSSIHDAMEAAQFARAALQSLTQPVTAGNKSIFLNINIGLALAPTDGRSATELLKSADVALMSSKGVGRNTYRFFDSDTENTLRKRRAIETAVKEACEQKLFELHYQPVFELRSGRLTGFEALIRLNHPHYGSISPAEFIPVAESIGLIGDIGSWTLVTACQMAAQWPDPLKVAVNLSPLQFRNGSMIAFARRSLEQARFPAYRLELEVTEGVLLDDTEYVREQLRALQETGVGIVLDDFGAGYSSLGYLWQFPFNKLKIDQSFVRAMDSKSNVRNILRAIIGLGRSLNLPITAEGVETAEQAEYLRSLDCTEAQGYYFGRPVPATEVAAIILRNFAETAQASSAATERNIKLVK